MVSRQLDPQHQLATAIAVGPMPANGLLDCAVLVVGPSWPGLPQELGAALAAARPSLIDGGAPLSTASPASLASPPKPPNAAGAAVVLERSSSVPGDSQGPPAGLRFSRALSLPPQLATAARGACEAAAHHAARRGRLRVWLPVCKTGGLTYTVAMLLSEAARLAAPVKLLVFGTDHDEEALAFARAGRYPARAALGMDPELRGRYTFDEGETIRMSEGLREVCIFSRHELTRDLPMARMDLVVCHRVIDGVPVSTRAALIDGFHYSLRDGGLLLALDHIDLFPPERFERIAPGYLRARPGELRRRSSRPPRLSVDSRAAEPGIAITFTDVTQLEAAKSRAIVQRHQHGAIARLSERRRLALELEASRLLAGASDLSAIPEGLRSALAAVLSVDEVELWAARDASPEEWLRIATSARDASSNASWTPDLVGHPGTPFSAVSNEHGELIIPVPRRGEPPCVLRLRGEGLREPDAELSAGLQRIGGMLAEFLERLVIFERSRQSEASYRRRSAELEALYASLPVGVTIHDKCGEIRHVNHYLAALDAPSDGASAKPLRQLYAKEVPTWIKRALDSGEPIHDVELFVTEGDRTLSWLCNFAPIRDPEGRVHGASAVVQDITQLKRVEATLREADQQKDDFLAMLGHELRNPMAAIRNATELLRRIDQPTPELQRLQSIFDRQTLQTTKLIDGLLDVARVARGKVELVMKPVQVIELVRQALDDRRQQFDSKSLDLRLPEGEIWVLADRVRLVQIVDNLISNALKFTRPRGRIGVEVLRLETRGAIRVEDDGVGIEPELLPQIFEPFRQGSSAHAQAQGLGLGLALVKGLVDLHGFQLKSHSDGVGRGAWFQIDFPEIQAPESTVPESRVDLRGLDLLIVEDNIDIAETLAELLTAAGHRVELCGSAEQALELFQNRRPEVVLCDIGLPGMDGLELAARLRADPKLMDLKLVAMTGFGDASTQIRIEEAGFDRHLIKPVQLEALRHCLSRVAALAPSRISRG